LLNAIAHSTPFEGHVRLKCLRFVIGFRLVALFRLRRRKAVADLLHVVHGVRIPTGQVEPLLAFVSYGRPFFPERLRGVR